MKWRTVSGTRMRRTWKCGSPGTGSVGTGPATAPVGNRDSCFKR